MLAVPPKVIAEPERIIVPVAATASAVVIVPERVRFLNSCEAEVKVFEVPFIMSVCPDEGINVPPEKSAFPATVHVKDGSLP